MSPPSPSTDLSGLSVSASLQKSPPSPIPAPPALIGSAGHRPRSASPFSTISRPLPRPAAPAHAPTVNPIAALLKLCVHQPCLIFYLLHAYIHDILVVSSCTTVSLRCLILDADCLGHKYALQVLNGEDMREEMGISELHLARTNILEHAITGTTRGATNGQGKYHGTPTVYPTSGSAKLACVHLLLDRVYHVHRQ